MNIHTKRLLLVPLGPQFLVSTHEYAGDIDNTKYMVHLPNIDISGIKCFLDKIHVEMAKM